MLDGVRILDLSHVLGGPFAGQLLAQLGAEVVKVESPEGDYSRTVPPHWFEGDSSFFLSCNRGKKSVVLDLKQAEGKQALYDLVKASDAVIYGFAPDVPKRLGIDFDSLARINPRIVVGELIGLHDQPPYSKAPSFDLIVQAIGGFMSLTGEAGRTPVRAGYQIADLAGGLYLALGTLGALFKALKSGKGTKLQVSLLDCQIAMLTWQAQNYFISGEVPKAGGARHPMIAPSEVFKCADGEWLAVSPTGEGFWRDFCAALGQPELATDPRFASPKARIANVDALAAVLSKAFAAKPAKQWEDEFFAARVPAGKVYDVAEAVGQPLAQLRAMVDELPHPQTGNLMRLLGSAFKFADSPKLAYPPALGQHTNEVLKGVCGYPDAKLQALAASGAIVGAA
jgi:crotonobetainyl-CoA:carnitine CoA-transferase CaiB-like acyl-CoA transferase